MCYGGGSIPAAGSTGASRSIPVPSTTGLTNSSSTGPTGSIPVANTTGVTSFVPIPSYLGSNVEVIANFSDLNGSCLGRFNGQKTLRVFIPINSNELHGPHGSEYLSNWLTSVRVCFFDAKNLG